MTAPTIGRDAFALGFAGLLPQLATVVGQAVAPDPGWPILSLVYGALILSFLGGIWWGFAVRRPERQTGLLLLAVAPSLVAFGVTMLALATLTLAWPLVLLGSAILLTLLADRHLSVTGEAPANWMRLRAPLSLGLGALTMAAGLLVAP